MKTLGEEWRGPSRTGVSTHIWLIIFHQVWTIMGLSWDGLMITATMDSNGLLNGIYFMDFNGIPTIW